MLLVFAHTGSNLTGKFWNCICLFLVPSHWCLLVKPWSTSKILLWTDEPWASSTFFYIFFIIILYPIPIWALRLCSLQRTCVGNASKPCIAVHFVMTLFIFASSHWESVKQNQHWLPVWFHPFPQTAAVHIHDSCYLFYNATPDSSH